MKVILDVPEVFGMSFWVVKYAVYSSHLEHRVGY